MVQKTQDKEVISEEKMVQDFVTQNAHLVKKWGQVIESKKYKPIKNITKVTMLAQLLENQLVHGGKGLSSTLFESAATVTTGGIAGYDPVLISMVRRAGVQNIAFDVCGVQVMNQPTGLVMALKARYGEGKPTSPEALYDEADTSFSGTGTHEKFKEDGSNYNTAEHGSGFERELGELLSTEGHSQQIAMMGITVESMQVKAKTRKLKSRYSLEVEQDMKALHNIDVGTEMTNILCEETTNEINREILRTVYNSAVVGAKNTTKAGEFDMEKDSGGRHLTERFKGLVFQIEKESNAIAQFTRRGRGNFIICTPDVASALSMAGYLDGSYATQEELIVDPATQPFAGVLHGKYKVYVDYFFPTGVDMVCVGYRGSNQWDAGLFYCPYVPFQTFNTVDPENFQPLIGLQTRYGLVPHPFAQRNVADVEADHWKKHVNGFFRIFKVTGINKVLEQE